jgi:hypothetical protein
MNKPITAILLAGFLVLMVSMGMLYIAIFFFPNLMEEYYNVVFRASSFETDWLFYAHPFVLSAALKWFWERYKDLFSGRAWLRALKVAIVYGVVAMLPVLWLTFSAIDISFFMVCTWLLYGIIQAFIAGTVFARLST